MEMDSAENKEEGTEKELIYQRPNTDVKAELPQKPFSYKSKAVKCLRCGTFMNTRVKRRNSMATYLFGFLFCLIGLGPCCCCFIPCCMHSCRVAQHLCRNCDAYLGEYRPH